MEYGSAVGMGSQHLALTLGKQEPRELVAPAVLSDHEVPGWQPMVRRNVLKIRLVLPMDMKRKL